MKISYIITINPIIEIEYLNVLVHSLNLQTSTDFSVIFYNQTLMTEDEIFFSLKVEPSFEYSFHSMGKELFFGDFPIWDLYGFHQLLLDNNLLEDYFMALHMEEFLEPKYTEEILTVLNENHFDILMGNLHNTKYTYSQIEDIIDQENAQKFNTFLCKKIITTSLKWGVNNKPFFLTRSPLKNFQRGLLLKFRKQLKPNSSGATKLKRYLYEDIFAMSTEFANRYNWYNSDTTLYFEDIHINSRLEELVKEITQFPVYFNKSKIFHLSHRKYYYQIEDEEFTDHFLDYKTENPILLVLKDAIRAYKDKNLTVKEAIKLSRQRGTVDYNYKFHKKNIRKRLL